MFVLKNMVTKRITNSAFFEFCVSGNREWTWFNGKRQTFFATPKLNLDSNIYFFYKFALNKSKCWVIGLQAQLKMITTTTVA